MTPDRHGSAVIEFPSELEIVTTREFDAPIELVFDVLTKPEHVSNWFAPFEDAVTECSIDLRVGGDYHFVFVTQDGTECSFRGTYLEVEPPTRTVADVAVRRVAGCGGRRDHGAARDRRRDDADDEAGVPRPGRPRPHDQARTARNPASTSWRTPDDPARARAQRLRIADPGLD